MYLRFYEILPSDLWSDIILNLNYNEVERLCVAIPIINNYCKIYNILYKRKYQGFPRQSGRCEAHDVSLLTNEIPESISPHDDDEIFKFTLNLMYIEGFDLVYGDLICFAGLDMGDHNGVHIFDGEKIIQLDEYISTRGQVVTLPKQFHIYNHEYWQNISENNITINQRII